MCQVFPNYKNCNRSIDLKGTMSWDFRLLVFFMNQFPPSPQVYLEGHFKIFENSQRYSQLIVVELYSVPLWPTHLFLDLGSGTFPFFSTQLLPFRSHRFILRAYSLNKHVCAAQDGKNGRGQPSSFLVLSQILTQSSMHENPLPGEHIATRLVIWGRTITA